jgi:hypothetical protein
VSKAWSQDFQTCESIPVCISVLRNSGAQENYYELKHAPQALQLERVGRSELNLDPTVVGLFSAIASSVSATSTPRTDDPYEAT